jgi:hypothetical protein
MKEDFIKVCSIGINNGGSEGEISPGGIDIVKLSRGKIQFSEGEGGVNCYLMIPPMMKTKPKRQELRAHF